MSRFLTVVYVLKPGESAESIINGTQEWACVSWSHAIKERDAANAEVKAWHDTLSGVMPPDFKDWHQNSKAEWPEIAAWCLTTARRERDEAQRAVAQLTAEIEALKKRVSVAVEPLPADQVATMDALRAEREQLACRLRKIAGAARPHAEVDGQQVLRIMLSQERLADILAAADALSQGAPCQ